MGRIDNISNFLDIKGATYPDESEGAQEMDIKDYIDRLDKDRRDSEQRLQGNMETLEQRLQRNMETLEQHLREDRQHMEVRLTEERRLSEERINKSFETLSADMKTTKWAIIALCISTLLGIASMVVAILLK